ncbi:Aldo/keto reductase family-domain-containing protein [Suillus ampliporus]|nr:Aldo/keto reductase family-domain-containing protein [Suillus ampliporus]
MVGKFDAPDAHYPLPPLDEIPDDDTDKPKECKLVTLPARHFGSTTTRGVFPAIIFGAASFSHFYNDADHISGVTPLRATRLALRYVVLGNALRALEQEFPRDSYTSAAYATEFDYTPESIESSVARSLRRMHTDYLDVVYLHDVEFVADEKLSKREGNHVTALGSEREQYGLDEGQEGEAYTEKDQIILAAVEKLFELRDDRRVIRRVGISGFPLPTLLRLAILVQKRLGKPLDLIMSYCQLTLQNSTIEQFKPAFESRAGVKQVVSASPLSMGLLRPESPTWHPAQPAIKDATKSAVHICEEWDASGAGLPNLALQYAFARSKKVGMPIVVGLSTLEDVHTSAKVWHEVNAQELATKEEWVTRVKRVQDLFRDAQVLDYSWATPS